MTEVLMGRVSTSCFAMKKFSANCLHGAAVLFTIFALGSVLSLAAQNSGLPLPSGASADKSAPGDEQAPSSLSEELRVKRAIKEAEKEYKQHRERAKELCDLGKELDESFHKKQAIDHDDSKKLERIEKLTKRIRDAAGGSDGDTSIEDTPTDLSVAIGRVAKMSASISEQIYKTPRQVVSATVIANANVLLELIRVIRRLTRQV